MNTNVRSNPDLAELIIKCRKFSETYLAVRDRGNTLNFPGNAFL